MRILFVLFFISLSSFSSKANEVKLENVALIVSSQGNSDFVDCAVKQAYGQVHTEFELFDITILVIDDIQGIDKNMFATIRTIGKHKETEKFEGIDITLRSQDEVEKWFYVQNESTIYPYSYSVDTLGTTKLDDEAPSYILLDSCI